MIDVRNDRHMGQQEHRARCACGWQGRWRKTEHEALADYHTHLTK